MRYYTFLLLIVYMTTEKNKNNLKKLPFFFNDDRYLPLGTFNVLILQTVCLTPLWSGLFWWGNNILKKTLNP